MVLSRSTDARPLPHRSSVPLARRLAAADMRAPSGDIIAWESPDMSLGHVARLVEVSIPIHVHPTLVGSPQSLPGPGIHSSTSGGAISGAEQHPPSDARTARLVFSADPLFTAIAAWDPVVAALFALACALAVLSSSSSRALFSPLSAALSSLTEAAAVLGDDGRVLRQGRVTTRGDADTLAVGQAVKRVLANLSLSSRATGRSEYPHGGASTPDKLPPMRSLSSSPSLSRSRSILAPPGALPRSLSKGPQASIAVPPGAAAGSVSQSQSLRAELESAGSTHKPPRSGRVFPIGAPDKPGASRDDTDTWTVEGLGKGRGREGREDVVESFTDSLERSKHSMKFTPAVLNKLGSTSWNANVLGRDELVSACHLMFIKLRVPESICTRERFVAFAERALERHPEMRFHNKR